MLLDPISGSILRVPSPPTRLRLATPQLPTFRLAAGALPTPDPRIRPKPLPTDRARSLPGLWHGDPSSSPRRDTSAGAHIKLTGSVLESRGGSLFARAEGHDVVQRDDDVGDDDEERGESKSERRSGIRKKRRRARSIHQRTG